MDTYAAWCGPCKAIVSSFKRIKNELGDDLLVFATVRNFCPLLVLGEIVSHVASLPIQPMGRAQ